MCHDNGFTIKINLFKYKRSKDGNLGRATLSLSTLFVFESRLSAKVSPEWRSDQDEAANVINVPKRNKGPKCNNFCPQTVIKV